MKVTSDLITIERQIESQLKELQEFSEDFDEVSWKKEDGVILSGNQAIEILKLINVLKDDK